MKCVVFYSWQSDSPNSTNRGFIADIIEKSFKKISTQNFHLEIELSLDRDTRGVSGSPNISEIILDKISKCDVFIADISIVTGDKASATRLSPNPNVLIELGYAVAKLGWEKIILVCNEFSGGGNDLPFDIRQHRRINYNLEKGGVKEKARNILVGNISQQLIEMISNTVFVVSDNAPSLVPYWFVGELTQYDSEEDRHESISLTPLAHLEEERSILLAKAEEIELVDGSVDLDWDNKKVKYRKEMNTFIDKLSEPLNSLLYQFEKIKRVGLSVENIGTITATNISIKIDFPDWLVTTTQPLNDIKFELPKVPVPVRRLLKTKAEKALAAAKPFQLDHSLIRGISNPSSFSQVNDINPNIPKVELNQGTLKFSVKELLHKHTKAASKDSFYIFAKSSAPKGIHMLSGRAFCSEYNDWADVTLRVEI
jgi:hypothetical protein